MKGDLVYSRRGKDKGFLMAVIREDKDFVYVVDGKKRRLENPKRKNPRHLTFLSDSINEEKMKTNRSVRRALFEAAHN
mgnify:CR=1 FL=1